MIFASNLFLLYFLPFFIALYLLTPQAQRNYTALLGSLVFYAWGAPVFIFVLLGSSVVDFFIAQQIYKQGGKTGQRWLQLGLLYNLGLLLYFKYANFFVENFNGFLDSMGYVGVEWTQVALPLGISFFTFQKLSYLFDVRRGGKPPLDRIGDYLLYVTLFPQLVAGPIVRYREIADQIRDRRAQETMDNRFAGLFRFSIGLARKVLIANPLAREVDKIFHLPPEQVDFWLAWLGPLAFAFVVYHDFAGYSDMALGLGRIMGFKLPENFNNPYISQSITEFWKRWHLTLTNWFRNYLFFPLRHYVKRPWQLYVNLWIVFLLAGLWHGAAWTFVAFGAWHGTWLTLDRLFFLRMTQPIGRIPRIVLTFLIVVVGCVFFKAVDIGSAGHFFYHMFAFDFGFPAYLYEDIGLLLGTKFWVLMAVAALFSFFAIAKPVEAWQKRTYAIEGPNWSLVATAVLTGLLMFWCISEIATMGFQPFIYYTF